jgi:ParB-like chromosome segregation protein Spo0J
MQIQRIEISKLTGDPANARKHGDRNIQTIVESLNRFGQQKPIVVDSSNCVRAGNGTLEAARSLGWTHLDCVVTDLKGSDAIAYAIADNRTAELAEWDDGVLVATLEGLQLEDLLTSAGFSDDELKELMEKAGIFNIDDIEAPGLADGDREPFQQMTFTLHDEQAEVIKAAIEKAKAVGPFSGPNENSNGNSLARIAEAYRG